MEIYDPFIDVLWFGVGTPANGLGGFPSAGPGSFCLPHKKPINTRNFIHNIQSIAVAAKRTAPGKRMSQRISQLAELDPANTNLSELSLIPNIFPPNLSESESGTSSKCYNDRDEFEDAAEISPNAMASSINVCK